MARALWLIVPIMGLVGSACVGTTCALDAIEFLDGMHGLKAGYPVQNIDRAPRWSPDGRHVVAVIDRAPHETSIYSVSLVDSSVKRVFINPDGIQASPQLHRDGRIVYTDYVYNRRSGFEPTQWTIGVASQDGTHQSQILVPPVTPGMEPEQVFVYHPSWVPGTDRMIALVKYQVDPERNGIHDVRSDGKLRRLNIDGGPLDALYDGFAVSPNGEYIAHYQGRRSGDRKEVWATISRADGSGDPVRAPIMSDRINASNIAWSLDSQRVFFATGDRFRKPEDNATPKIWSMNVDGSEVELIAEIPSLRWIRTVQPSPSGDHFALITGPGGVGAPFKIWSDGKLRDLISACCAPSAYTSLTGISWSPDGTRLAVLDGTPGSGPMLRTVNPDGSDVRTLIHREPDGSITSGRAQPIPAKTEEQP